MLLLPMLLFDIIVFGDFKDDGTGDEGNIIPLLLLLLLLPGKNKLYGWWTIVDCFFKLRIVEPGVLIADKLRGAITTGEGIGEILDLRVLLLLLLLVLSMN